MYNNTDTDRIERKIEEENNEDSSEKEKYRSIFRYVLE